MVQPGRDGEHLSLEGGLSASCAVPSEYISSRFGAAKADSGQELAAVEDEAESQMASRALVRLLHRASRGRRHRTSESTEDYPESKAQGFFRSHS